MQSIGRKGEEIAKSFLEEKGFKILETNYRFGKSEIDLIGKEHDLLVFIEVKTRKSARHGHPEAFVSENQQAAIIRGAEQYMDEIRWSGDIRFDIVSILILKSGHEIEHLKDAFY